jgi:chromosome segregation ATPase
MRLRTPLLFALLFLATSAPAQTKSADTQTLQQILGELRQLRRELQATAAAAQRMQILMYRLQAQETVVRRLQDRADDSRSKLTQIEQEKGKLSEGIKQFEDSQTQNQSDDPATRKEAEQTLANLKGRLEVISSEETETQAKLTDTEEQLRVEQAKLGRLQDELDRLDKSLEESSRPPDSATK